MIRFLYSNLLQIETPEEKCCREKGVIDECFGFCQREDGAIESRDIQTLQTGVCGVWFKQIEQCSTGNFFRLIQY